MHPTTSSKIPIIPIKSPWKLKISFFSPTYSHMFPHVPPFFPWKFMGPSPSSSPSASPRRSQVWQRPGFAPGRLVQRLQCGAGAKTAQRSQPGRRRPWFTLWLCQNSYWKWQFIVDFPIQTWWFSIAMLNYQRVRVFSVGGITHLVKWRSPGSNLWRYCTI